MSDLGKRPSASVLFIMLGLLINLFMSWRRFYIATSCRQLGYPDWALTHGKALCIKAQDGAYVAEPLADVRDRMEGR